MRVREIPTKWSETKGQRERERERERERYENR